MTHGELVLVRYLTKKEARRIERAIVKQADAQRSKGETSHSVAPIAFDGWTFHVTQVDMSMSVGGTIQMRVQATQPIKQEKKRRCKRK